MIGFIMLFLTLIADALLITLFNNPGYSEVVYPVCMFGLVFIILSYMSLVMPEWLIKRIKRKQGL
jgi:hypothetical protein